MKLHGREWTRRQLEAHVGRVEQIGGIHRYTGAEGREQGMEFIEVRTGAGLSYTVTPTKGLDFSLAEFGGTPISWQAAGGDAHPMYYEPEGTGWLRSASGGLMMTCGLTHAGAPSAYEGKSYGMHGRAHHLPARQVAAEGRWNGDEYEMVIRGIVEETAMFGGHLRLYREIRSQLGDNRITVTDIVENAGFEPIPHMLLYHFNFGYPLMTPDTRMRFPPAAVVPRDAGAAVVGLEGLDRPESLEGPDGLEGAECPKGLESLEGLYGLGESGRVEGLKRQKAVNGLSELNQWQLPDPGCAEAVYYHELLDKDTAEVKLHQPLFPQAGGRTVPLTVSLRWSAQTLPHLVQWKMPGAGMHVLGIEPANCRVGGIAKEAEEGRLVILQPGQTVDYSWELNID
ncbi:aldose 1-epimerase family protein [Paenibacillus sp. NPDC058174]|uniref:aldose 1-epimerase family protein n=1 Tax=Paenibacillus sp. NPDC058174 TaxID=3346366 RepID=UPI0036D82B54